MTDTTQTPSHPIGIDAEEPLHVALYVRSNVSAVSRRQIDIVTERLQTLAETPLVDDVRLEQWPPQHSVTETDGSDQSPREELVDEFEDWATQHGVSLRPAIRRQAVPSSLLGDTSTEIRVPVMTLALYTPDADARLRGVVPYTVDSETDDPSTYTVGDWLSAAEAETASGMSQRVGDTEDQISTA